jgi:hypothetical protein
MKTALHKTTIFVLLFLPAIAYTQKITIPKSLAAICDSLQNDSILDAKYVGIDGISTSQWLTFERIKNIYSDKVFYRLTYHNSPIIRAKSLLLLREKNFNTFIRSLKEHENDTILILYQQGCFVVQHPLVDFVVLDTDNWLREHKGGMSVTELIDFSAFTKKAEERRNREFNRQHNKN